MAKFKGKVSKAEEREIVESVRDDADYRVWCSVPPWVERIVREQVALGHKRPAIVRSMLIELAAAKYPDRVPAGANA